MASYISGCPLRLLWAAFRMWVIPCIDRSVRFSALCLENTTTLVYLDEPFTSILHSVDEWYFEGDFKYASQNVQRKARHVFMPSHIGNSHRGAAVYASPQFGMQLVWSHITHSQFTPHFEFVSLNSGLGNGDKMAQFTLCHKNIWRVQ